MTDEKLIRDLDTISNKGHCLHTVPRARSVLNRIKGKLTDSEWTSVSIALGHKELGEGAEEIVDLIKSIKSRYR